MTDDREQLGFGLVGSLGPRAGLTLGGERVDKALHLAGLIVRPENVRSHMGTRSTYFPTPRKHPRDPLRVG